VDNEVTSDALRVEVFCNHVASAVLIPQDHFFREPIIQAHDPDLDWSEEEILALSRVYCASREAVVRRLLVLDLTTSQFYEAKRRQYQDEFKPPPKRKGFVPPSLDLVTASGKPYVRTVLDAFYSERITASDVSDYLGIRLKHLDQVASILGAES
jgi:Zn-dependent peptidase ImmA (M78 family)